MVDISRINFIVDFLTIHETLIRDGLENNVFSKK